MWRKLGTASARDDQREFGRRRHLPEGAVFGPASISVGRGAKTGEQMPTEEERWVVIQSASPW